MNVGDIVEYVHENVGAVTLTMPATAGSVYLIVKNNDRERLKGEGFPLGSIPQVITAGVYLDKASLLASGLFYISSGSFSYAKVCRIK